MSVKFKKLAVASAVSASLGFAGMAQAEVSLLFPYITTGTTAYTFISIYHDADRNTAAGNLHPVGAPPHAARTHHLYYGFKTVGAAATAACTHRDFPVSVTQGALLQFEVGGKLNLVTEFADPAGYGTQLALANNQLPANSEGFLIVENATGVADVVDETRRGEAAVIDTATGLATAYPAIQGAQTVVNDGLFAAVVPTIEYVTSWYPRNIVTTSWYALPTGARTAMTPNGGGGIRASINPVTNHQNVGAYSRAENYTSGSLQNNLRCFGTFNVDNLLGAPFNTGGWMTVAATAQNATFTTAPVVAADGAGSSGDQPFALWKIQSTSAVGGNLTLISPSQARN
mgnify:CR=1 FL=1